MKEIVLKADIVVILMACLLQIANAQSKIQGEVYDLKGQPIANANVLLLNIRDSSLVKGIISSPSGAYNFERIKIGNYIVTITFAGLGQAYTPSFAILENRTIINLGKLVLAESPVKLNTVTVTAIRPIFEQKIDRLVVNVENSITSTGNTVLDVLERSPGVIVDHQNNTIAMNGKDGVMVMINGKISRMPISAAVQMFAGMSTSNVDKIELITTPPANLDAEGNAGYINVVLKENNNFGTNGSYSGTLGYGQGMVSAASMNINHRRGKVNVYADLSYSQVKTTPFLHFTSEISNGNVITEIYNNTDRNSSVINYNGRVGMDFQWNKRTVIGALFSAYDNKYVHRAQNASTITKDSQLDTSINIYNTEINRWRNYSGNINLQHSFRDGENLSVNADYIFYSNRQPVQYFNSYYNGSGGFLYREDTRSGKVTPIHIMVGAADYNKKLTKEFSMEAGIKVTKSEFTNDISYDRQEQNLWIKVDDGTATYRLDESYAAAYTSFNIAVSKRISMKTGLRYEYTSSNLGTTTLKNIVDRKYGNLFPTLFLSHKVGEMNTVNFSYNRRIRRPTFNDLAPFTYYSSPNSVITGNPTLQPAISNMVSLQYVFKKYLLSLSYTKEKHSISGFQVQIDSTTNRTFVSPENLINQKTVSLVLSVPLSVTKWWSMQYNLTGLGQEVNALYKEIPVQLQQANVNIGTTQRFSFPKEYSVELSGFYQSQSLNGKMVIKAFGSLDLGIKKDLGGRKGTFVLNGNNLLKTMVFRLSSDLPEYNLYSIGNMRFFGRTVKLTYSRNFGNDKLKGKRIRALGSEEERGRVQFQ